MKFLKGKFKKILGMVVVGAVFAGISLGALARDKNNLEVKPLWQSNSNAKDQLSQNLNTETDHHKICRELFEENEDEAILKGYTKKDVIDCSFASCSGAF